METSPDFLTLENKVFTEIDGKIYLGRHEITKELRALLKEQAKYIQTSQLWEIFNASVVNEAYNLALLQSKDYDEVKSAKMLHHWSFFMRNLLNKLAK